MSAAGCPTLRKGKTKYFPMDDEMAGSKEDAAPMEKKRKVRQEQGTWGNWEDTTTLKKPTGKSALYAITDAPFPGEGGIYPNGVSSRVTWGLFFGTRLVSSSSARNSQECYIFSVFLAPLRIGKRRTPNPEMFASRRVVEARLLRSLI